MSKLKDLEAAATAKLGAVPAEVMSYLGALKARVQTHETAWIAAGCAVGVLLLYALIHHLKH